MLTHGGRVTPCSVCERETERETSLESETSLEERDVVLRERDELREREDLEKGEDHRERDELRERDHLSRDLRECTFRDMLERHTTFRYPAPHTFTGYYQIQFQSELETS